MANEKTFAIKEVMSCVVHDYTSGEAIAYIGYAQSTDITTDCDRLNLTGGQGNFQLTSWDHSKKMTSLIKVPLVDIKLLGHLTGTAMATGATTAHRDEELVTVGATPTITLSSTPTSGTLKVYVVSGDYDLTIQAAGTPSSTVNTYSLSTCTVTLNSTTAPAGTRVLVTYDFTTTATANLVTVLADKFTDFVRITGMGLWRNVVTGDDEVVSFDLRKCKFKSAFKLTQSSTEATSLDLEADLFYETSGLNKVYANIVKI
jgi:hypothetical protein